MILIFRKNRIETNLNVLLGNDSWDLYTFSAEELECLALFGDVMRFDPKIASRLISKLAEFIQMIGNIVDVMDLFQFLKNINYESKFLCQRKNLSFH